MRNAIYLIVLDPRWRAGVSCVLSGRRFIFVRFGQRRAAGTFLRVQRFLCVCTNDRARALARAIIIEMNCEQIGAGGGSGGSGDKRVGGGR